MKIHVVRTGETLWRISNLYKIGIQEIANANNLDNPNVLVVGQALVIPTPDEIHVIRAGETLWTIARRYNVSLRELISENQIENPDLVYPGTTLRIPKPSIEVNGYLTPTGPMGEAILRGTGDDLTYVSIFSYAVRADGSLSTKNDTSVLQVAKEQRVVPLMSITNFAGGLFSKELAHAVLSDTEVQEKLLTNIVNIMREKDFGGLNIDFEYIPQTDRELYNSFLRKAADRMRANGYSISTALAPKYSAGQAGLLYEAHDYPVHGQVADFVVIMTYEWGWSGGAPWAIAPINEVRKVLDYAVTVIPRNKIMMGIPLYAYDWNLPYVKGTTIAEIFTPDDAVRRAASVGTEIQYNELYKSPFYRYRDASGTEHEVWFEDVRSYKAKYDTIREYGLRGASYWELNLESTQNWPALLSDFRVKKLL